MGNTLTMRISCNLDANIRIKVNDTLVKKWANLFIWKGKQSHKVKFKDRSPENRK
jgi:hypothetical protein